MEQIEEFECDFQRGSVARLKVLNRILINLEDPDAYAKFSKLKVNMHSSCFLTHITTPGTILTKGDSSSQAASEKAQCSDETCQILSDSVRFCLLLICS